MSASISLLAVRTLPDAESSPDEIENGSADTSPSWSRVMSASSCTCSASTGRSEAGSAEAARAALSLSNTEPSASETSPVNLPSSASLARLPSVTVSVSVASVPAMPALILPATSGAMVGLSMIKRRGRRRAGDRAGAGLDVEGVGMQRDGKLRQFRVVRRHLGQRRR